MWFDVSVADAYTHGIEPALSNSGYRAMRIDRKEHNNKIDDEILAEIRRSRFVVADFTCGMVTGQGDTVAIPRGGVYYEAGFAQGLEPPVIWCVRADQIGEVDFDTRQFNHITWSTPRVARTARRAHRGFGGLGTASGTLTAQKLRARRERGWGHCLKDPARTARDKGVAGPSGIGVRPWSR